MLPCSPTGSDFLQRTWGQVRMGFGREQQPSRLKCVIFKRKGLTIRSLNRSPNFFLFLIFFPPNLSPAAGWLQWNRKLWAILAPATWMPSSSVLGKGWGFFWRAWGVSGDASDKRAEVVINTLLRAGFLRAQQGQPWVWRCRILLEAWSGLLCWRYNPSLDDVVGNLLWVSRPWVENWLLSVPSPISKSSWQREGVSPGHPTHSMAALLQHPNPPLFIHCNNAGESQHHVQLWLEKRLRII